MLLYICIGAILAAYWEFAYHEQDAYEVVIARLISNVALWPFGLLGVWSK